MRRNRIAALLAASLVMSALTGSIVSNQASAEPSEQSRPSQPTISRIESAETAALAGDSRPAAAASDRPPAAAASESKQRSAADSTIPLALASATPGNPGEGSGANNLVNDLFIDQLPFGQAGKPTRFDAAQHTYSATAYYHTDSVSLRVRAVEGATVTIADKQPDALGRVKVQLARGVNPVTVKVTKGSDTATYVVNITKVDTDFRGNVKAPLTVVANGATAADNTALTDGDRKTFWEAGNTKSATWNESVTGLTLKLGEARDISRVTAFGVPAFAKRVQWWHGGVGISIAVQAEDDGPWREIANAATLRRDAGGIFYWDFNAYHRAKNIRVWFNDRIGGEVPTNTEISGAKFFELEAWGMPAGKQAPKPQPLTGDSLKEMFDPGTGKWGVNRAQTLALHHGILLPAWIPSQGYARGAMDAREQAVSGGVIPMFYDPPLFNSEVMARLGQTPWALAKAPTGGNSMRANPEPKDFLTDDMRPYAKNLVDIQYGDEGGYSGAEVELFKKWFAFSKSNYPGAIVHSNQNENVSWGNLSNMKHYVTNAAPDLLSWDTYYFGGGGVFGSHGPKQPSEMVGLLNSNMWTVQRQAALEGLSGDGSSPILYGQYLDYSFDANVSESQKAIIPMLSLASGQKWFGLFRMEYNGFDFGSLIDHDGAPTRAFYEYARVFDDVKGLGRFLVALNNRFVAIKGGTYADRGPQAVPKGWKMDDFDSSQTRPVSAEFGVVDVQAKNLGTVNAGKPGDVVLGYFDKLPGLAAHKTAQVFGAGVSDPKGIMVVNSLAGTTKLPATLLNERTDDGAYWQTTQDVTLTLAKPTNDAKLMIVDPATYDAKEAKTASSRGGAASPAAAAGAAETGADAAAETVEVTVRLGGGQGTLLYWTSPNPAPEFPVKPSPIQKIGVPFHPAPVWADSEAIEGEQAPNGRIEAAFDGTNVQPNLATFWHSQWQSNQPPFPHAMVVDKGKRGKVCGLAYAARAGTKDGPRNVSVFGGTAAPDKGVMPKVEEKSWEGLTKIVDAELSAQGDEQIVKFESEDRFIGLAMWDNHSGKPFTALADLRLIECKGETSEPTPEPTAEPTGEPTSEPTGEPTSEPTGEPTSEPTGEPTSEPTGDPTGEPTSEPTGEPSTPNTALAKPGRSPLPVTGAAAVGLIALAIVGLASGFALIRRGRSR